jgi:hypothetical protein
MKTFKTIVLIISLSAFLESSCRKGSVWGIKGEGETLSEKRTLNEFNAINLPLNAEVIFVQDSLYFLEVTAQKNILPILETKVNNNTLNMDFSRKVWKYQKIKMSLHAPNIAKITISGDGQIEVNNTLNRETLDLDISGSGNVSIATLSVQNLTAKISGSGKITVSSGNALRENFSVSGSGEILTEFLDCEKADVNISGSGQIRLKCSQSLNVNISGSGHVLYRGKPAVNASITGSGKLDQLD